MREGERAREVRGHRAREGICEAEEAERGGRRVGFFGGFGAGGGGWVDEESGCDGEVLGEGHEDGGGGVGGGGEDVEEEVEGLGVWCGGLARRDGTKGRERTEFLFEEDTGVLDEFEGDGLDGTVVGGLTRLLVFGHDRMVVKETRWDVMLWRESIDNSWQLKRCEV